ncbi:YqcC family protein [Vibrio harveyi]|uniref:YqcC family protein n=1 Tax=Vibrio harveyi TaxID=669 RepID=UPI000681619E|nr:YqcC family protein [Vibrio harveyi]EMD1173768.1 YqcC family protein [Vibrio harveyi]
MATNIQLVDLLQQLEAQLQHHELWQQTMPSAEALQSTEPFAIDTLHPHEWLQWIFIARIRALVEDNQPLPRGFSIEPYFAEVWKQEPHYAELLVTIRTIDELCK